MNLAAPATDATRMEVSLEFRSFGEWMAWLRDNAWAIDGKHIANIVGDIRRGGLIDPLWGYIPPDKIDAGNANYREGLIAERMNSRLRAVCLWRDNLGERRATIRMAIGGRGGKMIVAERQ